MKIEDKLFLLGIFSESGSLLGYVKAGRPSTVRVYETKQECINGIRQNKRKYSGELKPVKLLTGEVVE